MLQMCLMILLGFLRICHSDTFHFRSLWNMKRLFVISWLMLILTEWVLRNEQIYLQKYVVVVASKIEDVSYSLCTLFRLRLNKRLPYSCTIDFQCHPAHTYFSLSLLIDRQFIWCRISSMLFVAMSSKRDEWTCKNRSQISIIPTICQNLIEQIYYTNQWSNVK